MHVYDDVTAVSNGQTCYTPGNEVTGVTVEGAPITDLTGNHTITVSNLGTGARYIAIHLDYGLKGATGYAPNLKIQFPNAIQSLVNGAPTVTPIPNNETYTFSATGVPDSVVSNENVFKNDPGIGGLVLTSDVGNPVAGTTVEIWQGTKIVATVQTDADGWYMWTYKYTGKAATFTVKVPAYNIDKTITLKANGYVVVSFNV